MTIKHGDSYHTLCDECLKKLLQEFDGELQELQEHVERLAK